MTNHKDTKDTKRSDELSKNIIGAAIEVHRNLGPGLLESAYEKCLCYELASKRISFERQKNLPITYKDIHLDCGYRIDILVEKLVIIELKTVEHIESIHEAQLLTYLKLSDLWLGLLINFNIPVLKEDICRIAN